MSPDPLGPEDGPVITVKATNSGDQVYGKNVSDYQTGIVIDESAKTIKGTLNYVEGCTGFSGDESKGNFLYLSFEDIDADTITTQVEGGKYGVSDATIDKYCLYRIIESATGITINATKDGHTSKKTYDIQGLTRTPGGDV